MWQQVGDKRVRGICGANMVSPCYADSISLEPYVPKPLSDMAFSPRTNYHIAKHGLASQRTTNRPELAERGRKAMTRLPDDQSSLGGTGEGWETLVDRAKLKIFPIQGNHFVMIREPYVITLHTMCHKIDNGRLISTDH